MNLLSVRTNTNFSLNYEDQNLHPEIEVIVLVSQPKYKLKKQVLKRIAK